MPVSKPTNRFNSAGLGANGSDFISSGDVKVHHAGAGTNDGSNQYYPEVEYWLVVKPIGGDLVFGAGCVADVGDEPQDGETRTPPDVWQEGPLTAVQLDATSADVRLIRG